MRLVSRIYLLGAGALVCLSLSSVGICRSPLGADGRYQEQSSSADDGDEEIYVFVQDREVVGLRLSQDSDVSELRQKVAQAMYEGVPTERVKLAYGGKNLLDGRRLKDYHLPQEATIFAHFW